MVLKSLQISGFKSFPDKIKLDFEKGITACVGPNGSGKSNISDAMRWVLGEQAPSVLRIKNMEKIIFEGSDTRKAQGMAEVILVIDNSDRRLPVDSDEVAVARRYYRSGASDYLINGKSVRLLDINRMFMDTGLGRDGYSIIGQGRIADIVTARSKDRRVIFEEAAGISKYRYRRAEAENYLKKAEDNLVHLNVLMSDLEGRVGPLEKEAEKAKKYRVISEELKVNEIGLWLATMSRSKATLRDYDYKIMLVQTQQEELSGELEQFDADVNQLEMRDAELLAGKDESLRNASSLEEQSARLEGDAAVIDNDISHCEGDIKRIEEEIEQSRKEDSEVFDEISGREKELENKRAAIGEKEKYADSLRQQAQSLSDSEADCSQALAQLINEQGTITADAAGYRVSLAAAQSQISELDSRGKTVEEALASYEKSIVELEERLGLSKQAQEKAQSKVAELTNAVAGIKMKMARQQSKMDESRKLAENLRVEALQSRKQAQMFEDLEKNLDGFQHSVKTIMKRAEAGALRGIHGPVSKLIEVPDEYATAIEVALGATAQNIVVDNEDHLKRAVEYLKQNKAGRATFLSITTIKGKRLEERGLEDFGGYVGIASDFVSCDPKYDEIVRNLLGRVCVVETLTDALEMARRYGHRFRVVTLDGQIINAGGSVTGGYISKKTGLISRKSELEKLRATADELEKKSAEAQQEYERLKQKAAADEAQLVGAQGELTTAQEDRMRFEADARITESQIKLNREESQQLRQESSYSRQRRENLVREQQTLEEKISECEEKLALLGEKISERSGSAEKISGERERLSALMNEAGLEILALAKEAEAIEEMIASLNDRRQRDKGKETTLREQIVQVEERIKELAAQAEELRSQAQMKKEQAAEKRDGIIGIERQRDSIGARIKELRQNSRDALSKREEYIREIERLGGKKDQLSAELDNITLKLSEEYGMSYREASEHYDAAEDEPAAKRKVAELRGKIRALGHVNLGAEEEFKVVFEKYTTYKTQMTDIEKSKAELLKMIDELTENMKVKFTESFKLINKNFSEIFPELFGGGSARLELSEPEDCLNSGIAIEITAPGKSPKSDTESFSGGEKALIAVAIYFAIMKVNPSPFCVLDEIDSALDEHNVDNIARYIDRMSDTTQYIVITHRRGMMEAARMLYGVTKKNDGVSRLIELDISEVEEKLGMTSDN
ncbi:MAG: chromosome segregation protein SMC [Ruminococcaceae bacterium]|nr:chromosome segregation protein SMC [Oscillospiraceae bacterium]